MVGIFGWYIHIYIYIGKSGWQASPNITRGTSCTYRAQTSAVTRKRAGASADRWPGLGERFRPVRYCKYPIDIGDFPLYKRLPEGKSNYLLYLQLFPTQSISLRDRQQKEFSYTVLINCKPTKKDNFTPCDSLHAPHICCRGPFSDFVAQPFASTL